MCWWCVFTVVGFGYFLFSLVVLWLVTSALVLRSGLWTLKSHEKEKIPQSGGKSAPKLEKGAKLRAEKEPTVPEKPPFPPDVGRIGRAKDVEAAKVIGVDHASQTPPLLAPYLQAHLEGTGTDSCPLSQSGSWRTRPKLRLLQKGFETFVLS